MNKKISQNIWWASFLLAILLLIIHTFALMKISVDSTSILLLIIILISPFINSIRRIKYGDFEAEIDPKEIQKIKKEADGIIESSNQEDEIRPEIYATTKSINDLASSDPIIALAKLRIELEKTINKLATISGVKLKGPALSTLVRNLSNHGVITVNIGKSLTEVIGICNRAIHGEAISESSAKTIISLGVNILEDLYWTIKEQITSGNIISEETLENSASLEHYQIAKYRLTTIIPLVENPKKIIRNLNQEQLDELLENYKEYAEFIVELIELPNNDEHPS